ncbi:MAG: hypothetical protein AAFO85_15155 [Cyanobacteria bacterium J06598_4]
MKKTCHQNAQRHVNSLLPIVELYIASIADIEKISDHLNDLPEKLKTLQQQAELLNLNTAQSTSDSELQLQQTEFILDSLVDDLDRVSTNFSKFEYKLKNIVALQERLEALQTERINGLTSARIYKLLEKERQELLPASTTPSKKKQKTSWRKLIDLRRGFSARKLAISMAVIAGLSFAWLGGYSSAKDRQTDSKMVETVEQTDNSLMKI